MSRPKSLTALHQQMQHLQKQIEAAELAKQERLKQVALRTLDRVGLLRPDTDPADIESLIRQVARLHDAQQQKTDATADAHHQ